MSYWVSTDLDGTLLDHHNYSYAAAKPALKECALFGTPILLNTSKTRAETLDLHSELKLNTPLIVENGSALVFPTNTEQTRVFGVPRKDIVNFISEVRMQHGFELTGFNDWTDEDIAKSTGLPLEKAAKAAQKEFSEPFVWHESEQRLEHFRELANDRGLEILKGGRFFHLQGRTDKAKPLLWLKSRLRQFFPDLDEATKLICLGDNHNDVAMLNVADVPVCVRSPNSDYPELDTHQHVVKTEGLGPIGWNQAILSILNSNNH